MIVSLLGTGYVLLLAALLVSAYRDLVRAWAGWRLTRSLPAAQADADAPLFRLAGVSLSYSRGTPAVTVFDGVTFAAPAPTGIVGIEGPSGGGKTSLLNLLAGLDVPTAGEVRVLGELLPRNLRQLREHRRRVGLVLQQRNLIDHLSARDNVAMPLAMHGMSWKQAYGRADRWLGILGLENCAHRKPGQLSGGQQQRVAIARALAAEARLILADEPTSALDPANAQQVLMTLRRVARDFRVSVVIASHDRAALAACDHLVRCVGGVLTVHAPQHRALPAASSLDFVPDLLTPPSCHDHF